VASSSRFRGHINKQLSYLLVASNTNNKNFLFSNKNNKGYICKTVKIFSISLNQRKKNKIFSIKGYHLCPQHHECYTKPDLVHSSAKTPHAQENDLLQSHGRSRKGQIKGFTLLPDIICQTK
jgi:hypothetical protein